MDLLHFWPPLRIVEFVAGCLLASHFLRKENTKSLNACWGIAWLLIVLIAKKNLRIENATAWGAACLPGFLFLIYGAARTDKITNSKTSILRRFLIQAGDASYTFYMIHTVTWSCEYGYFSSVWPRSFENVASSLPDGFLYFGKRFSLRKTLLDRPANSKALYTDL